MFKESLLFKKISDVTRACDGVESIKAHKQNEKKMEEEIKALQKHMAGMERTILDLKAKVEALQKGAKDQLDR